MNKKLIWKSSGQGATSNCVFPTDGDSDKNSQKVREPHGG